MSYIVTHEEFSVLGGEIQSDVGFLLIEVVVQILLQGGIHNIVRTCGADGEVHILADVRAESQPLAQRQVIVEVTFSIDQTRNTVETHSGIGVELGFDFLDRCTVSEEKGGSEVSIQIHRLRDLSTWSEENFSIDQGVLNCQKGAVTDVLARRGVVDKHEQRAAFLQIHFADIREDVVVEALTQGRITHSKVEWILVIDYILKFGYTWFIRVCSVSESPAEPSLSVSIIDISTWQNVVESTLKNSRIWKKCLIVQSGVLIVQVQVDIPALIVVCVASSEALCDKLVVKFVRKGRVKQENILLIEDAGFLISSRLIIGDLIAKRTDGFFAQRFSPSGVDSVIESVVERVSFLLGGIDQISAIVLTGSQKS